ncbi:MAG: hypothetical protein JNK78_16105 [Planctomycetes bacterium]|nr:hypothetical protein [Planctomycetota bacterium]
MSTQQRTTGEAFAIERLRANPDLDFAALRTEATQAGVSLAPIHYGRARKQLGLPALRINRPPSTERGDLVNDEATATGAADAPLPAAKAAGSPKKGSVAFEFLLQELRREPAIVYADLRRRAEARGHTIAPIMYGRAKAVLGLVPVKPRGKKAADNSAAAAPKALRQVESAATDRAFATRATNLESVRGLEQLVAVVKDIDADRRRLRSVLERIGAMIQEALARG